MKACVLCCYFPSSHDWQTKDIHIHFMFSLVLNQLYILFFKRIFMFSVTQYEAFYEKLVFSVLSETYIPFTLSSIDFNSLHLRRQDMYGNFCLMLHQVFLLIFWKTNLCIVYYLSLLHRPLPVASYSALQAFPIIVGR